VTEGELSPAAEAVPLRLPDPGLLFDARAARLRTLAAGHAAREWLLLLARIAAGQARAVRGVPAGAARAPGGGPPLAYDRVPRDAAWRQMLGLVLSEARSPGLPVEADDALRRLSGAQPDELESLAGAVLAGDVPADRLACAPFVGAALQAWLTALAAALDPTAVPRAGLEACPACGGPPMAGVVQADRLRYVTCAFCSAEWHVPRLRCTSCASDDVEYLHAEDDPGAKAEACRACRGYLKLFDQERRLGAEPAADDAATIALDLLVADEGYRRAGPNLYVAAGVCDEG
jgi:FdhE protein